MEKIIVSCNICGGFISERKRKLSGRRKKKRGLASPYYVPHGIHICKTCREQPNVKKALSNQKGRYKVIENKEAKFNKLWKQARELDANFTELIEQFHNEHEEEKENAD